MKKNIILFVIVVFSILLAVSVYLYFKKQTSHIQPNQNQTEQNQQIKINHGPCLSSDEIVKYKTIKKDAAQQDTEIYIYNSENVENNVVKIENIYRGYHPIESYKCGIYMIKFFNYNSSGNQKSNFRAELWIYKYNGYGENLITLDDYSFDFRIDPSETYAVLQQGYLGTDNYSLIIKSIETKEDVFVMPLQYITDKYSSFIGSIGMNQWTKDGKYFWGDIYDGANILTFFRIERDSWKVEIFLAPAGTMGGDALNPELGYITYDNGAPWTGMHDISEEIRNEWKKEGKLNYFYLYNLFTKKQILVDTIDDPTWNFEPDWISDTELEYYVPSYSLSDGEISESEFENYYAAKERKIYKINEK